MSISPLVSATAALRVARETVADADPWSVSVTELGEQITALQVELDALAGTTARWTSVFAEQDGPADAGAGSLASWLRRELRVTRYEATRRVRTGRLLADLPATAKALQTGQIGAGHVQVLASAAHQLGPAVIAAAEPILLPVAQAADPDALTDAIRRLRDTLDPDAADAAYIRALEQRDVTLTAVGDLYQLHGVLDPVTGQTVKTVLYALAKPDSDHDPRTAGQRRVDALRTLCDQRLRAGVPTDHGHRPHLFITTTRDRLSRATPGLAQQAVTGHPTSNGGGVHEPATLHGYGTISDILLTQLACDADQTEVTTDESGTVLDVGRTKRLATSKQRIAIFVAQHGICAAPGCRNTHLEIHHRIWWSHGGGTDLKRLAGYCSRCHHLIHAGLLIIKPDDNGGWTHHDRRGRPLTDRWRDIDRTNRDHLHHLAAQTFDDSNETPPDESPPQQSADPPIDPAQIHNELQRYRRRTSRRNPSRRWPYARRESPPDPSGET